MHKKHEIHGIDGDCWTLFDDGDGDQVLHYQFGGESMAIPIDEAVLAALWCASRPAAVVLDNVVQFPVRRVA